VSLIEQPVASGNSKKQRVLEATDIFSKYTDYDKELDVRDSYIYGFAV
jgi:hypothetical protein